jgi:hypothetical protein
MAIIIMKSKVKESQGKTHFYMHFIPFHISHALGSIRAFIQANE